MSEKRKKLFVGITLAFCLLLFGKRLTGEIFHAILGILFTGMMVLHAQKRAGKRKQKRSVQVVDGVSLLALAVVFFSGMLLHPLQGTIGLLILHKLSAVVFVLAMLAHVLQHRQKNR
ncbi:MAG: hypothetical protein PUB98_05920 [Clostridiales bacterium]|nr:hypothetical protein [Clostridiales bacterium]